MGHQGRGHQGSGHSLVVLAKKCHRAPKPPCILFAVGYRCCPFRRLSSSNDPSLITLVTTNPSNHFVDYCFIRSKKKIYYKRIPNTQTSSTCSESPFHPTKASFTNCFCCVTGNSLISSKRFLNRVYLYFFPAGPPN